MSTTSKNLSSETKELTSSFKASNGDSINGNGFIIGQGAKTIPGSLKVEYNLNKDYKIFEAVIAPSEQWTGKEDKNIGMVKIYQNGHLIYDSGNIASNRDPIPVRLSLVDVNQFRIEAYGRELGLLNAKFIK
ncbi:NPCBM/NEW2 domain-containing protein [Ammoniphilus sp. CFH 90114]|uniref:NPCBM/NEW2 domain-containing protein n=1 Tax=Ammoniphilus sp. CFH 90114 TaxID=2493665 RepID=UPI00100FF5C0|nr:NPCBM/NEW2 domain-containing protein [Ammoniphilus sp. CFH 90114]RXT04544.1 hypothetical protein EIZ39_20230 [Ammoniphilus sp. CFH 90114]